RTQPDERPGLNREKTGRDRRSDTRQNRPRVINREVERRRPPANAEEKDSGCGYRRNGGYAEHPVDESRRRIARTWEETQAGAVKVEAARPCEEEQRGHRRGAQAD